LVELVIVPFPHELVAPILRIPKYECDYALE
jgi:hypothetical protein